MEKMVEYNCDGYIRHGLKAANIESDEVDPLGHELETLKGFNNDVK